MRPASPSAATASCTSKTAASSARRATRLLLHSLSALGGGEGWGEVGDSRALADTHLTLPSLRDGPLPLPPEGRRGERMRSLRRLAPAHQLGYGARIGILAPLQRGDDARAVRRRAVLAQLELALEPADRELDAGDAVQHRCDISLRQIVHAPGRRRLASLMALGQPAHEAAQPFRIGDPAGSSIGVDGGVVPGRHGGSGLIPARRDVGVGPLEDRERLARAVEIGELRVGAGEMAPEVEKAVAVLEEERDLAGDQPLLAMADEHAELVAFDVLNELLGAGFGEGGRQIDHGQTSRLAASQPKCWARTLPSSATPQNTNIPPEPRLIQIRCLRPNDNRTLPAPKANPAHHNSEPSHTPKTRITARPNVASEPLKPMPAKIARKARIVIGLVMVSAKAEA